MAADFVRLFIGSEKPLNKLSTPVTPDFELADGSIEETDYDDIVLQFDFMFLLEY
jgi:hypothetical protein